MFTEKERKYFEEMVLNGIEEHTHPQSDEIEPPITEDEEHYMWFDEKLINVIEKSLKHDEFIGFLKGSSMLFSLSGDSNDRWKALWYEQQYENYKARNKPHS